MPEALTGKAAKVAEEFYKEVLGVLNESQIPYMVGGTFAFREYTGIKRSTKDLDFFCKAGDMYKILKYLQDCGYNTEVEDERWVAKATKGRYFVDFIFGSGNAISPVTDSWFKDSPRIKLFGVKTHLIPPEDLLWSKMFVQSRTKYDGADVAHLILKQYKNIDWKRLLSRLDPYWEVLLIHILNFRFIYPSEREIIPLWLLNELIKRVHAQEEVPTSQTKVCRGRLFSRHDYEIDITQWEFADIVGYEKRASK